MADKTGISWCDATWSPVSGCTRVSPGCESCWAEEITARFSSPGLWGEGYAERGPSGARWTRKVALVPKHLSAPLKWKKPRRIFVNSRSDTFHEKLSFEEIAAHFGIAAACPQHTFIFLTKRAERMPEWFRWIQRSADGLVARDRCLEAAVDILGPGAGLGSGQPWPLPNAHLGVSAEDQQRWDERVPELLKCPAAVRWVSVEPQIGEICPSGVFPVSNTDGMVEVALADLPIHWIVQGGESGPDARPFHLEWARSMRDACREAGAAYFFKQAGSNAIEQVLLTMRPEDGSRDTPYPTPHHRAGEDPRDWPEDLQGCRAFPDDPRGDPPAAPKPDGQGSLFTPVNQRRTRWQTRATSPGLSRDDD